MNACPEGGGDRRAREARRNGAVVHPWGQSGQGRRWGGRGLDERRMERRCAGAVDALGVARGEMGKDLLDELGRLDARDDAQRAATHATVFDVDVEDALEPLHPAHGRATRRRRLAGGVTALLYQGACDTGGDGVEQALELGLGRSGDAVEPGRFVIERVGAVDEEHVQVRVEVERRAEALDEGDGAGAGVAALGGMIRAAACRRRSRDGRRSRPGITQPPRTRTCTSVPGDGASAQFLSTSACRGERGK